MRNEEKKEKILIIGCGGVGSEIIKLLRHRDIVIADFDTVQLSNLNRQFYFSSLDIGRFKAQVISEKVHCPAHIIDIKTTQPAFFDDFSAVFCCVDSVSVRMEVNWLFKHSTCEVLVDCGVEDNKAHTKIVTKITSCLYCMKDLFAPESSPHACSLSGLIEKAVTKNNRHEQLIAHVAHESFAQTADIDDESTINKIILNFNKKAPKEHHTTYFEVFGLYHKIIPNSCVINSICASMALELFETALDPEKHLENDFIFYNGVNHPSFVSTCLQKDECCLVCSKHKGQYR
ncbi:NEDD8-activating enzyme E1 [Enteropsectra breve]|nr:NEDD8-activating enzyme E1 [Enteropsectra breve]